MPALAHLPEGVERRETGDVQRMKELFGGFFAAMGIGLLCIYAVLVLLFHDFIQPLTILGALPQAVGGALAALLMAGYGLSLPSLIGLLMLMGIVTKNSILLVEYVVMARRDQGLSRMDALIDACAKRARPIIMTTIAMIAGMFPVAAGWSADPSFRSPMGLAVIGGLITSTALSLFVVPTVYTVLDDFQELAGREARAEKGDGGCRRAGALRGLGHHSGGDCHEDQQAEEDSECIEAGTHEGQGSNLCSPLHSLRRGGPKGSRRRFARFDVPLEPFHLLRQHPVDGLGQGGEALVRLEAADGVGHDQSRARRGIYLVGWR